MVKTKLIMDQSTQMSIASRPIAPPWRRYKAYLVTLIVLSSYLRLRFFSRFRSRAVFEKKLHLLHIKNARRIYRAIVELQGLFIKVGQLFSCMSNFLPPVFRNELSSLQDQVPPHSFEAITKRIRDEFSGKGPDELFASFDPSPLASASIGQVHRATLTNGDLVAVKVQYPDIERVVRADLRALKRIFSLVQRFIPYKGMDSIYREIREIVLLELDYTVEAQNASQVALAFKHTDAVSFPKVVEALSTKRVLTTEYVEGMKANSVDVLNEEDIDRKALARLIIESYCQQIFSHGAYHADPHPGNILVSKGPKITFIDFGAVAELSESMRQGLMNLIHGALHRDTPKITRALQDMGFIAHRADPEIYDRVIEYFYGKLQQELQLDSFNLKDLKFDPVKGLENIADLRQMDISLADITDTFHVPKEWIMLERTILMVMGLCTELDPDLNPMEIIRPHIEELVLGKEGDWSSFMLDTTRDVALSVLGLPNEITKFTSRAIQGGLSVKTQSDKDSLKLLYTLGHQFIYTAIGIASTVLAIAAHDRSMPKLAVGAVSVTMISGLLLLRSFWTGRKLLGKRKNR